MRRKKIEREGWREERRGEGRERMRERERERERDFKFQLHIQETPYDP